MAEIYARVIMVESTMSCVRNGTVRTGATKREANGKVSLAAIGKRRVMITMVVVTVTATTE